MAIGTSGAVLLLLGLLRMVAATLPVHHGQAKDILGKILADRKAARRPFRLRTQSGRLLLQDAKPERTQAERNACSNDSVVLSSNFVTRRFKEEHAILEEIDFLRRFGTLELLDGDTESPVGRVESAALLRSVVQHQKTVWVIENQLYALNHILGLRRKYGILDDISLVFMTTYAFGFNASKQALVSHQYRAPAKGGGKRVIRLSEADAKYLDAIIIHQPLLRERWPSLTGQMQYLPNWPRGRPLKLSSLASRGATPSGDRFVLMAGEQGRDFATGLEACKSAGLAVRLVTGIFDAESLPCSLADSCTLTKFMKYSDYMVLLDKAWAVVVPLLLSRRLSSGAKMVGEAMAAGIPVVVSGHPSSDPWLGVVTHEQNGLIVPPGDQKELTAALLRLKNEPGLHARLRARALKEAEMYSLEAVGERMQDIACEAQLFRQAHRTPRSQNEQEKGNEAFNALVMEGDIDFDP